MPNSLSFDMNNQNYNENEIVTVKFHMDSNEILTQAFNLKTDISFLRAYLQHLLNVDLNKIIIDREESTLEDGQTLEELGATSLGIFELSLRGDGVRLPKPTYYLPVVDVITVNVNHRRIVVEIEHCTADKPWLGGYRDRNNGKLYYHATAQTTFRPNAYLDAIRVDRQSQTCVDKGIGHAPRCAWTQTADACDGKIIRAHRYKSYQTWLQEDHVLGSVLIIQRAFRRMAAARRIRQQAAAAAAAAQSAERQKNVAAASSASTSAATALETKQQHFCSLYTTVGKWWKKERQRIRGIAAEKSRRAAQLNLLKKEIEFLMEVEKQRLELKYELTKHDDMTFLNKMSKPRMFKNKTGKLLTVDTVGNQKARALREIYANLCGGPRVAASADRAGVLDELRAVVDGSGYKYKNNLLDAIAMETGLARMRADERSLRSVRSRVEQMFRHFIRQPEVNPEAESYYRPTEKRILNMYTCIRCKRNLAATDFSLESRVNRTNVCANCEWTEQVGHKRIDMAPYRRMLKALRQDEMQRAAYESECFLMQPTEVYRLVSIVWNEKSAVSECSHLNGLRLVRWRQDRPWSPWNCVLLTRSEAEFHCRLDGDPAECYETQFVQRVTNRHAMARLQFGNLVRAANNRKAGRKTKTLPKNWSTVATEFNIKI